MNTFWKIEHFDCFTVKIHTVKQPKEVFGFPELFYVLSTEVDLCCVVDKNNT